jgi:hypothetical protein
MVVGRALLGDYVHARCGVLCCSLEDSEDEFDRRVAAAMLHHGLDPALLAGQVHVINGRGVPEFNGADGRDPKANAAMQRVRQQLSERFDQE